MRELQAVEVEAAVIDLGLFLDGDAATIVPAIADGDLERPDMVDLATRADLCRERPHAREGPSGRDGVAELAPALFHVMGQFARELNAQPHAGHVEEELAID